MFEVILYQTESGYSEVDSSIRALSEKQQNKVFSYIDRLAQYGYNLKRPTADSLGGGLGLYELRPGRHRILYFIHQRSVIVLLHIFLKKTDEIPKRDIEIALSRKQDYIQRESLK